MARLLGLAFVLRLAVALWFWNVIAPDEVFQSLEQAHRLVFGQGVVPWEFQVGLRCWLIPLILAAPMALAHALVPAPLAGLTLIRVLLCLASLPIVACAALWGREAGGARGFWIAGILAACWPDLLLMAPHPLEEVFAADCLVPAAWACTRADTRGRIAAAGLLLGLAFTFRLQLAPAIAIAGIWLCRRDARRWAIALAAAALPVLLAGALDWAAWGQPFRSLWLNVWLNLVLHVAAHEYGSSPALFFLGILGADWLWTLPVLAILFWQGMKTLRLPAAMALAILITHSLIAHKELRFVFPAIALAVPVAGAGLAALLAGDRFTRPRLAFAVLLLAGPALSPLNLYLLRWQTGSFALFRAVAARQPGLVSVQGWDRSFLPFDILFGGGTVLTSRTIDGPARAGFVLASAGTAVEPGYTLVTCRPASPVPLSWGQPALCVWAGQAGQGGTTAAPAPPFGFPFPKAALPYRVPDRF